MVKDNARRLKLAGGQVRTKSQVSFHLLQNVPRSPDGDFAKMVGCKCFSPFWFHSPSSFGRLSLKTLQDAAGEKQAFRLMCLSTACDQLYTFPVLHKISTHMHPKAFALTKKCLLTYVGSESLLFYALCSLSRGWHAKLAALFPVIPDSFRSTIDTWVFLQKVCRGIP